ncbi:MAG: SRPBCC family protein [Myxococcota bacterium]|nr:SRPBCC family protein [Myxococcota bacterium]
MSRFQVLLPFRVVIEVQAAFEDSVQVSSDAETSFALVSDIARSGAHFPSVDRLTPVDDAGRWRWKLKEKGIGPVRMKARYDAVYSSDPATLSVDWRPPVTGSGDMKSYGSWKIEPGEHGGAILHFFAKTVIEVPAPGIFRKMVEAFAREEMVRQKKAYLAAIAVTLNQGTSTS